MAVYPRDLARVDFARDCTRELHRRREYVGWPRSHEPGGGVAQGITEQDLRDAFAMFDFDGSGLCLIRYQP